MSLGLFIRNYRLAEDLTQEELASRLKVSKQRISDIELNRFSVSLKLCKRIAAALDLPAEWPAQLALQDQIKREGLSLRVGQEAEFEIPDLLLELDGRELFSVAKKEATTSGAAEF